MHCRIGFNYTIETEDFFPLPAIAIIGQEAIALVGQAANSITQDERTKTILTKQPIYAPVSSFEFHRTCTNEEFFDQAMSDL